MVIWQQSRRLACPGRRGISAAFGGRHNCPEGAFAGAGLSVTIWPESVVNLDIGPGKSERTYVRLSVVLIL